MRASPWRSGAFSCWRDWRAAGPGRGGMAQQVLGSLSPWVTVSVVLGLQSLPPPLSCPAFALSLFSSLECVKQNPVFHLCLLLHFYTEHVASETLLVHRCVRKEVAGRPLASAGRLRCVPTAQSCLTLCDPVDWSPGSSIHRTSQTRILERLPCSPPGNPPEPGIEPMSPLFPALQAGSLSAEPSGKPLGVL